MGPQANPSWPAGIIPTGESTCEVVSTESKNNGFRTMAWRNKSVATVRIRIFFHFLFLGRERGPERGGEATDGRLRRRLGREEGFRSEVVNILFSVTSCILGTRNNSLRSFFLRLLIQEVTESFQKPCHN